VTILLHGFWGEPANWSTVCELVKLEERVLTPDLHLDSNLLPGAPLDEWTDNFWEWVDEVHGSRPVQLVGYSMGGRLALNAIHRAPKRVERALILAANPIPPAPELAHQRELWEQTWARNFLTLSWNQLRLEWENQEIFADSQPLPRRTDEPLRLSLASSLKAWSPRRHLFAVENLKSLPASIEWVFGALDQKYLAIAKCLRELPVQGQINHMPQAGHRLIPQATQFIADWIGARGSREHRGNI
jgi:2-succinyl-6-hydroxy-2,4-cyclohexadiene-1-carboxylate synthase